MAGPNWDEFERARPDRAQPAPADAARFDELCHLVFASGHGAELMNLIRARTIEKRSVPGASDALLREDEGARRFVQSLEIARNRGAAALKPKPEKAPAA